MLNERGSAKTKMYIFTPRVIVHNEQPCNELTFE